MSTTYQPRANSGNMIHNYNKKADSHSDFKGSIYVDKDYLIDLIKNRTDQLVEIKLGGWKKVDKNGKPMLGLQVDTWQPTARQDAAPAEKDPWE